MIDVNGPSIPLVWPPFSVLYSRVKKQLVYGLVLVLMLLTSFNPAVGGRDLRDADIRPSAKAAFTTLPLILFVLIKECPNLFKKCIKINLSWLLKSEQDSSLFSGKRWLQVLLFQVWAVQKCKWILSHLGREGQLQDRQESSKSWRWSGQYLLILTWATEMGAATDWHHQYSFYSMFIYTWWSNVSCLLCCCEHRTKKQMCYKKTATNNKHLK